MFDACRECCAVKNRWKVKSRKIFVRNMCTESGWFSCNLFLNCQPWSLIGIDWFSETSFSWFSMKFPRREAQKNSRLSFLCSFWWRKCLFHMPCAVNSSHNSLNLHSASPSRSRTHVVHAHELNRFQRNQNETFETRLKLQRLEINAKQTADASQRISFTFRLAAISIFPPKKTFN